jgi:hypothetical protein
MRKVKERVLEQRIERTSYTRAVRQVEKQCPVCQRLFWGAKISRYCSRACKSRADYGRHVEQRRQQRVEKYHAEKKAAGKP